jgi:2-polyprenyl-6-methoxyphenol hydroxylase-like FAD-dependent oxidoreductase
MIIIIGAGLSGLSLARYLQAQQIPFRIFDQVDEQKPQGYGLTLRQETVERLVPVLGLSEAILRTAVAVDKKAGAMSTNLMHIITGEKLGAGPFKPEFLKDFRANRKQLRLTIQGAVNVEFNHRLVNIESKDDSVIASFANGAQITGDLLVAADGIHSFSEFLWFRTCSQSSNA